MQGSTKRLAGMGPRTLVHGPSSLAPSISARLTNDPLSSAPSKIFRSASYFPSLTSMFSFAILPRRRQKPSSSSSLSSSPIIALVLTARTYTTSKSKPATPSSTATHATATNPSASTQGSAKAKSDKPVMLCGLDEAGRGPILGPMVLAACFMTPEAEEALKNLGVKDSKLLSHSRREILYDEIRSRSKIVRTVHLSPKQIDDREGLSQTLNQLQLKAGLSLFDSSEIRSVIHAHSLRLFVDSVDVNTERYARPFREAMPSAEVVSAHHADSKYTVVAAASVIAKVERDRAMRQLEEKYGVALGSGYLSDATTIEFLKAYRQNKHPELESIVRKTWKLGNII